MSLHLHIEKEYILENVNLIFAVLLNYCPGKVQYQVPFAEAQNSKTLPIVFVLHLLLIHFGEGDNITSVTET